MSYDEYTLTLIKYVENLSKLCKEQENEIKDLRFVINNKDSLIKELKEEIQSLEDEINILEGNNLEFSKRS